MFTPDQVRALQTLVRIWSRERFAIIGASAMRWHLGERSRATHDIDLILGVTPERYPAGLEDESGWSRHPRREHTWIAHGNVTVDIVPAGEDESAAGILTWPESGSRMNLAGLRLALDRAVPVEVAAGLTVRMAPLELIALLKMVAFLDRPYERDRDLADIALILDEYVDAGDERRYGDEIFDHGLAYEEVSPFLLGRRLSAIVGPREKEAAAGFIDRIKGTDTPAQARMLSVAPAGWRRDPGELLVRIAALERGFEPGGERR